ncbi:uncharacterized protein LOC107627004 [Arachis ipaensis]|uniref:uncharacterized protein LOC107627004 n=1 Tax=Arachis ipaensis TaxID=130454 RepID=UPI0007AF66DB|nr:uncharacterized protein LOC107627004 [Arachis ipaensis]XP_025635759.1 uncharacterized protein LOC112729829 [Arachis hypogaea]
MRYDGTQDLQEHLTAFETRMNFEGVGDAVKCRAFPVTLAGPVIRWFNTLPQGFITTFSNITRSFLAQFTTRIAKAKHVINLLRVTQSAREPTRKFLDRFNDECLEIDGLTDLVTSLCLTNGLLNEDFRKHLTTKPVWTMQDIQNIAIEYINDEEVTQVVEANKRQPANPTPPPIVEVYQQIADKGILSKPRQLKDRTGGNKSLYCDHHKGFGHKTQDYFDLKDALKQAICRGKMTEISQFIRDPRRRERKRSKEDRGQAVMPRQGPSEDADNSLTVVNVMVERNVPDQGLLPKRTPESWPYPRGAIGPRPGNLQEYRLGQKTNDFMTYRKIPLW